MREVFGTTPDGRAVQRLTLRRGGTTARVITWGASLQDLRRDGVAHPLVLGAEDLAAYLGPMRNFGANVGRVANRIAGGTAPLDGRMLMLDSNEGGRTCLHGGSDGTWRRIWEVAEHGPAHARLRVVLPDGHMGFPGRLDLGVLYEVQADGALVIAFDATTDAPTFCNPAHHSYWNLDGTADLSGHRLSVAAPHYLPVDARGIPLGAPQPVAGTRFDFRAPQPVGQAAPLDHNFCLGDPGPGMHAACTLEAGGLRLSVTTTAPGLQVYDGAGLDTTGFPGLTGRPYGRNAGLALEPQGWPDAPNHPEYPPILLRPGEGFAQVSRFHISAV